MEPTVADAIISIGGLLALEYKNQILNSTKKKRKRKRWIRKRVAKRDELGSFKYASARIEK